MEIKKLLAVILVILAASPMFAKKGKKAKRAAPEPGLETVAAQDSGNEASSPDSAAPAKDAESAGKDSAESSGNHPRYTISAIEEPEPGLNYYVTRDENERIHFVQKLSWNKIPDIKHYHIVIQRLGDNGEWSEVLQKDLHENKIEVSLEAGKYRFQVSVVNLFDQTEKSSEWRNFEVLKALQPKIDAMQTDSMFLNSKKATGLFTLRGENLTENTMFTMEQRDADPPKIIYGRIASISPDGQSADVQFNLAEISEGKYEIYAQNPGGLSVISKTIHIKNKKDRNWRFLASAGYTFPLTFFDGTFNKYTGNNFYPLSGTARVEVISFHTKYGDFGFMAMGNFTRFGNETESYSLEGYYTNALGGLVWQKYFIPKKLCIDVHAGAGAGYLFGVKIKNMQLPASKPNEMNSLALAFGGGLGLQYHIGEHFYMEGAVDFVDTMFGGMNLGMIYPSISIGGMF